MRRATTLNSVGRVAGRALAATLAALWSTDVAAQELTLGPSILQGGGETVAGFRAGFTYESGRLEARGSYPRESVLAVAVDLPLARKSSVNPESLAAEFRWGYELSLYRPPDVPEDPVPGETYGAWDYGFLGLELRGAVEAPQDLDLADLSLGAMVSYEHNQYQALWFVPEAHVSIDGVACVACELPPTEEGGSAHARVDTGLGWNLPLDRSWMPSALRPLWLRMRGRAFWTLGISEGLSETRLENGTWGSSEVAYRTDRSDWLHEIYVRWAGGAVPVTLARRRAWTVGISVLF